MSVVVWDGKTLAADRLAFNDDLGYLGSKLIWKYSDYPVVAWTGGESEGRMLAQWFYNGANPDDWPTFQNDENQWARLIVADNSGCRYYERRPIANPVIAPYLAWGSGRDFAMGALAMGADARKAVEIANELCTSCGFGVEAVDVR